MISGPQMYLQRGMSMIEMMVALTIGMVMMGGLIAAVVASQNTHRLTSDIGLLQENGRYALDIMSESIQMAGHWGGVEAENITLHSNIADLEDGDGSCTESWIVSVATSVQGYEGGSTAPLNCISSSDYRSQTDMLVVRYASTFGMKKAAPGSASDDKFYLRSNVSTYEAEVFRDKESSSTSVTESDTTYSYPYTTELYYVSPCQTSDCSEDPDIPTLYRLAISGTKFKSEPLVSGVENLQLEYGWDSTGDNMADTYGDASAVTDWDDVRSVRVALVTRSLEKDSAAEAQTSYSIGSYMGSGSQTVDVSSADQHYRRKIYTRVIQLRNRG